MTGAVDQATFAVRYDGEALREHRMDVRELAPALLGLAEAFQAAHATLNPGDPPVSLEIRATDEGSFIVDLTLSVQQHVESWLVSKAGLATSELVGLLMGGLGLFSWASRKRRARSEAAAIDGSITLVMLDGTVFVYPAEVMTLSRQPGVQQGVQAAIRPLAQPGIDTLEFKESREAEPWVTVTDEDTAGIAEAMADGDNDRPPLVDTQYDQLLTVDAPNFQHGKWKVRGGTAEKWFWVSVDDPAFWAQVDAGQIAFTKGDRLLARVWLRQWETDIGDITTERSIIRVTRHIPANRGVQEMMFGDD